MLRKECSLLLLALLQIQLAFLFSSTCAKGQSTVPSGNINHSNGSGSPASVVGFAVVVSILVVAVVVVVMVCIGYGMCKAPCKRQSRRSDRQIRSMIPLPSPRTVQPSTASTNPLREQQNQAFSSSTPRMTGNNSIAGRDQNGGPFPQEVLSAPPISTNVVHLSQLQSLSYHSGLHHALDTAIEQGVISTSPLQNHSGPPSMLPAPPPHRPFRSSSLGNKSATTAVSRNLPSHMKPRLVRPPPPYPGIGYPYQPCKPPTKNNTPNSISVNILQLQQMRELPPAENGTPGLYARRHAKKPRHSNGERERGNESTDFDTTEQDTEVGENSVMSHVTDRSSPPSYSTEV